MKAVIDGVEVDGTPTELAEFITALKSEAVAGSDTAMLTPKQLEVYTALQRHPNGAHYAQLAKEIGLAEDIVNSRLNDLVRVHEGRIIMRVCAGTFKVTP